MPIEVTVTASDDVVFTTGDESSTGDIEIDVVRDSIEKNVKDVTTEES